MSGRGRLALWHSLAALGMGAACTIATLPFTTGDGRDARVMAAVLFASSTLLSALVGLCSSSAKRDAGQAARIAAALAPAAGVVNSILTYTLSAVLTGEDPFRQFPPVLVLSFPVGGMPGMLYSLPLGLTIWGVRSALLLPRGTSGASSRVLAGMSLVALATTWVALGYHGPHPAWPLVTALLSAAALSCLAAAVRDLVVARRLGRLDREEHDVVPLPEASLPAAQGVATIVPFLGPWSLGTMVTRLEAVDGGAYRASVTARPALVLPGHPRFVRRRLLAGAPVLGALALLLALTAWAVQRAPFRAKHRVARAQPVDVTVPIAPPPPDPVVWSRAVSGRGSDDVLAVAADAEGNVYVAGERQREPAEGAEAQVGDPTDAWIASFARDGSPRWEHRLRARGQGEAAAVAVAAARDGSIHVAGRFQGRIDLGGTDGVLTTAGRTDAFVASYSSEGALLWARRLGGGGTDRAFDVAADPDGQGLVVVGIRDAQGGGAAFIESLTASGRRRWSRTVARGNYWNAFETVAVGPGGEVVAAGKFMDDTRVRRPDALVGDFLVLGFSPEGHIRWTRRFGGPSFDTVEAVAMDGAGDAWVAGSFGDTVDFGSGELHETGAPQGSNDAYVVRLGPDGATRWAVRMGGPRLDAIEGLAPGPEGDVLVFGNFMGSIDLGGESFARGGPNDWDLFAARLGPDGRTAGFVQIGQANMEWARGVALLPGGDLAVVGGFTGDTALGTNDFTAAGHDDGFVAAIRAP